MCAVELIASCVIDNLILEFANSFFDSLLIIMRFLNFAAKVLHQTAKTSQYLKEIYKKMHFFLIYDENFHLLRSGDKKSSTV